MLLNAKKIKRSEITSKTSPTLRQDYSQTLSNRYDLLHANAWYRILLCHRLSHS